MNEYKYQMRRKKRGQHCLIQYQGESARECGWGMLCGCGCRTPPSKRKKTRIVKRALQRSFDKELNNAMDY